MSQRPRRGSFRQRREAELRAIVLALLVTLNGCGTNDIVLEDVFERVYTIEPNANISIQDRDGAVLVYSSDANEMRVRAVKKAYSRERLSQMAIDVSQKPGAVSVITPALPAELVKMKGSAG